MNKLHLFSLISVFNLIIVSTVAIFKSGQNENLFLTTTLTTPTPIVVVKKVNKLVKKSPQPVTQNVLPQSPAPITNTNACVIKIDGTSYDITSFIRVHSGGNIFKCGADMSQSFWSQHSQKQLNQLQKYRI